MCERDYEAEIESLMQELLINRNECQKLKDSLEEANNQVCDLEKDIEYLQGQVKAYEFCIEKLCGM